MFDSKVSSKRSPLPPQIELELVNIYLGQGRIACKDGKQEVALVLCEEAEASLSKMKKGVKAAEAVQDIADLRRAIACAFFELSQLLEELNRQDRAKQNYRKAQEWGYTDAERLSISALPSLATAASIATQMPSGVPFDIDTQPLLNTATSTTQPPSKVKVSTTAQPVLSGSAAIDVDKSVAGDFFTQDKTPPVIDNTEQ
ncbi:hypothetical protein KVV02_006885 [Mortierella alpina]|uniref:Uncharacterized protein n=1 Tax=Mortierella alpina TaxID=64518 RepID=A0A9P8A1S5_MORAP|nr:hypothetical protein KVV02_006885 [Mortierella alpina]